MKDTIARRRLLGAEVYDQSEQGTQISVRSVARMRPPLTVYGHSKQDGTPSPENPVPIVSAGDSGEIGVTVQGGNLFDKSTITPNKYVSDTSGNLNDSKTETLSASDYINVAGMSFIFATMMENGNWMAFYDSEKTYISGNTGIGYGVPIAVPENAKYARVTVKNDSLDIFMLNAGSTALPYEPYKQPQTLTIQTPGGLPGIPVTSGGNYTDESGQQWVCDEIDYKRGKYVQRVKCARLSGDIYDTEISFGRYIISVSDIFGSIPNVRYPVITSVASTIEPITQSIQNQIFQYGNGIYWYCTDYFSSKEELQTFLEENDVTIIGHLAEPIETDLPAEEIAAYKSLHMYSPTTTVSNDAGAWMKIVYQTKKSLQLAN